MLHRIDQPDLIADLAIVITNCRKRKMNAVGQPGAVNEDIRSFMPFLQEFGILS